MLDSVITGYTYLGFATPTFVLGLVLLWIFGYHFVTFPTNGSVGAGLEAGSVQHILSKLNNLILPSLSITLIGLVMSLQYLRSCVIEVQQKDYAMLARANEVKQVSLYIKHLFSSASIGIAAFFGYERVEHLEGRIYIE